jgi:Flp pilus assembly protein TadG
MTCSRTSRQHGSAIVEFALILPILLLLLAGIYGIGRAYAQYETLTKATRDGARLLSITNKATISSTGVAAAKARVTLVAQNGGMPDFSDASMPPMPTATASTAPNRAACGWKPPAGATTWAASCRSWAKPRAPCR